MESWTESSSVRGEEATEALGFRGNKVVGVRLGKPNPPEWCY
jgi:hypothetical protein